MSFFVAISARMSPISARISRRIVRTRFSGSGTGGLLRTNYARRRARARSAMPRLPADDRLLALQPPVIASQRAGAAEHAMTGHDEGNRVAGDRRAHRPRGA